MLYQQQIHHSPESSESFRHRQPRTPVSITTARSGFGQVSMRLVNPGHPAEPNSRAIQHSPQQPDHRKPIVNMPGYAEAQVSPQGLDMAGQQMHNQYDRSGELAHQFDPHASSSASLHSQFQPTQAGLPNNNAHRKLSKLDKMLNRSAKQESSS